MLSRWAPNQKWEGEDAYVLGGGTSLDGFDWGLIEGEHVVGCNGAFQHGAHIVPIVVFGDDLWWDKIAKVYGIDGYGGIVVTTSPRLRRLHIPWLLYMHKEAHGLHRDKLGWNGNTGSLAVNLALILGARRVFLLGFDMKLGRDEKGRPKSNYHDLVYESPNPDVYPRFCEGFKLVAKQLPVVFPGCEIWNVTDGSELNSFPKIGLREHFEGKGKTWKKSLCGN